MQATLKEDNKMIKSFEGDIRRNINIDKINKDIKQMEKEVGSEMPQEYKENLVKNRFRQSLNANKHDKEFVEFFWDRMREEITEQVK